MAYQETNTALTEITITAEEAVEFRDQSVEHKRLRKSGKLKKTAEKIIKAGV